MNQEPEFLLETQQSAIAALEELIADIKSGSVVEFMGMAITVDEGSRFIGGATIDRHRAAGMMLELAVARVQQSASDDEDDE